MFKRYFNLYITRGTWSHTIKIHSSSSILRIAKGNYALNIIFFIKMRHNFILRLNKISNYNKLCKTCLSQPRWLRYVLFWNWIIDGSCNILFLFPSFLLVINICCRWREQYIVISESKLLNHGSFVIFLALPFLW